MAAPVPGLMDASLALSGALYLGASAVFLIGLSLFALTRPRGFLMLTGAVFIAGLWRQAVAEAGAIRLGVDIGPVSVGALDVLVVAAATAAAAQALRQGRLIRDKVDWLVSGLTLLTAFGLAHWVVSLGLEAGVNAWRSWLYALGMYWWAKVVLCDKNRTVPVWLSLGLGVALLQAYGYATTGFGWGGGVLIDGTYFDARPVHAQAALLLVLALLIAISGPRWTLPRAAMVGILSVSVILSMHRSVWVAAIAGLAVWILRVQPDSRTQRMGRALTGIVAVAVAVLVASRSSSLTGAAEDNKTLLWRYDLWIERIGRGRSVPEWLLGGVAVPDSERDLGSFAGTAHNMYIDALEMYGLLGLVIFVLLMIKVAGGLSPQSWPKAVIVSIYVFGLFYPWPVWGWIVLAVVMSSARISAVMSIEEAQVEPLVAAPSQPGNSRAVPRGAGVLP